MSSGLKGDENNAGVFLYYKKIFETVITNANDNATLQITVHRSLVLLQTL